MAAQTFAASPLVPKALAFDKPLCASLDGFTLHAATRAGALDTIGREALCKYVLRPPVAQERVTQGPDGLVRIALKKPFSDGTVAVDMDPLSLLCRTPPTAGSRYRPWAELLKRCFAIDVLECPTCKGRMKLLAMVIDPHEVKRFLHGIGEPTEPPARLPARGPPYWQSRALRRTALDLESVA